MVILKAPPTKTCVVLGKTGVSDVIVDGFVSGVNLDVTQGVASLLT